MTAGRGRGAGRGFTQQSSRGGATIQPPLPARHRGRGRGSMTVQPSARGLQLGPAQPSNRDNGDGEVAPPIQPAPANAHSTGQRLRRERERNHRFLELADRERAAGISVPDGHASQLAEPGNRRARDSEESGTDVSSAFIRYHSWFIRA